MTMQALTPAEQLKYLHSKLADLKADAFATPEEIKATEKAISEVEKLLDPLPIAPVLDAAIKEGMIGAQLNTGDVMSRADYEEIVNMAHRLGIDSLTVAQLWSQLECVCKEISNTRFGLFCLRILVENAYMHKQIGELNKIQNHMIVNLSAIHSRHITNDRSKKKNR